MWKFDVHFVSSDLNSRIYVWCRPNLCRHSPQSQLFQWLTCYLGPRKMAWKRYLQFNNINSCTNIITHTKMQVWYKNVNTYKTTNSTNSGTQPPTFPDTKQTSPQHPPQKCRSSFEVILIRWPVILMYGIFTHYLPTFSPKKLPGK